MAKVKNNSYYAISPKEFHNYCGTQLETLRSAYACKLADRAGAQNMSVSSMEAILCTAFGGEWYLQPYSKLYKLAKSASCKTKRPCAHIMPKDNSIFEHNYAEDFADTSLGRITAKFYGKRTVKEFLDTQICKDGLQCQNVANKMVYAIKLAKLYANYDRKDLSKLRKLTGSQFENMQYSARAYAQKLSKEEHGVMPEHILKELMQDELETLLSKTINGRDMQNIYACVRENIMARIWGYAWRTGRYDSHTRNKYIGKMCDNYDTYKRIKEMEAMTKDLGVMPADSQRIYHKNSLCNKTYQAVKQIYNADLGESVKRKSLEQVTGALYIAHDTNRVWAPRFVPVEGKD